VQNYPLFWVFLSVIVSEAYC